MKGIFLCYLSTENYVMRNIIDKELFQVTFMLAKFVNSTFAITKWENLRTTKTFCGITFSRKISTLREFLHFMYSMQPQTLPFKHSCILVAVPFQLLSTAEEVSKLRVELEEMQPLLEQAQVETEETMEQIKKDKVVAEETKVVVQKEEKEAKIKADETQAIADDAQADLDEALPALVRH